jgi:hypothetical protein
MDGSIPHPHHFCPLFALVFFLVEPPVMVFGLYYHGSPSSGAVTAGRQEKHQEYAVKKNSSHHQCISRQKPS